MQTKTKIILISIASLLGLGAVFASWQYWLITNSPYKIKNFKIWDISLKNNIRFKFDVLFENLSMIGISVLNYNFDIFLNNKYVGNVKSNKEFRIESKLYSIIPVDLDVNPKTAFTVNELIDLTSLYISDKSKILINLKGSATVKILGLKVNVKTDIPYTLKELMED